MDNPTLGIPKVLFNRKFRKGIYEWYKASYAPLVKEVEEEQAKLLSESRKRAKRR